jgi:hypothetical protein
LCDQVDVAFVFDFGGARVLFAEDFSGFASGFDGDFEVGFQIVGQSWLLGDKNCEELV